MIFKVKGIVAKTLAVLAVISLIGSCCGDPPDPILYSVQAITVSNFDLNTTEEINEDSIPIQFNNFGIFFKSSPTRIASNKIWWPSMVKTANAAQCRFDQAYIPRYLVNDVEITTLNDFNSSFPAGADVLTLFDPYILKENCVNAGGGFESCATLKTNDASKQEIIRILNDDFIASDFFNSESPNRNNINIFKLKVQPEFEFQQFSVKITFDNGEQFIDTTAIVKIRP